MLSSMLPWMPPAQENRAVLLRAVHQEEPHGGAKASCHEAVQRPDGVDVNGVVCVRRIFGRAHAGS